MVMILFGFRTISPILTNAGLNSKFDAQDDCCAYYVHAAPAEGPATPSTLRRFTCYVRTQCDPCASVSFQRL